MTTRKIAIACQGGGAHAAFTWGVMTEILKTKKAWSADADGATPFEFVAFSGTSAGALCALAAWYGLTPNLTDADCGTVDKAVDCLDRLWTTFAATTPIEHAHNNFVQQYFRLKAQGLPFADFGPYAACRDVALTGLSLFGARSPYLGFPDLLEIVCPHFSSIDWPAVAKSHLRIVVGAIEVLSGNFEVFDSEKTLREMGLASISKAVDQYSHTRWRMRRSLSLAGVAASGTLPEVLRAQTIEGLVFPSCEPGATVQRDGLYWDGLYSQNPPVRDFLDVETRDNKPDEIWVIRINPQEYHLGPQLGLEDIRDRANALAGNLSLNQELDYVLTVNDWLDKYGDESPPLNQCKTIDVRTIKMTRETAYGLCQTSKLDRSPRHLEALCSEGRQVAEQWLGDWRARGPAFATYPNDARYPKSNGVHPL